FGVGLLDRSEWKGKWIGNANQLRRDFTLKSKPARARAYVAGVGYYELRLNGRKVGDHVLDSAYTPYAKRVLYSVYDVTNQLQAGPNTFGLWIGEGWYANRAAIVQLNVEYANGERAEVVSDASWKSSPGPIVSDSVYNGETFDTRAEQTGWDR